MGNSIIGVVEMKIGSHTLKISSTATQMEIANMLHDLKVMPGEVLIIERDDPKTPIRVKAEWDMGSTAIKISKLVRNTG